MAPTTFAKQKHLKETTMKNTRITQVMKAFKPETMKKADTHSTNNWMTFGENNEYEISVASDFRTRQDAYFLLYKSYAEKEYITPNPYKLWYSIHDANKSTFTIVVKKVGKVTGAVTVNFKDSIDLPACQLFHKEVNHIRLLGHKVCEITSFAIDSKTTEATEVLIKLFNFAYLVSKEVRACSGFIITVNPKHEPFYRRKLLFSQIGKVKEYEKVGGAPATFLFLNFDKVNNTIDDLAKKETTKKESLRTLYVRFNNSEKLIEIITNKFLATFKPMSKKEINLFFYDNLDKWNSLNQKEKELIQQRIFEYTFDI